MEPPLQCKLMLSRGGPLLLCTKLILLRGGTSFTMSIDGFKGWIPFYTICWWYPGVEPLLHCMLMKSRGGTSFLMYSRVHKSSDSFFSKILEKPSIVQKKMIPHIKGLDFSQRWSKKKFKMADLENSKWPPQKNLIFQLRQFSIFFHENFMD